jgi:hypothetical protein
MPLLLMHLFAAFYITSAAFMKKSAACAAFILLLLYAAFKIDLLSNKSSGVESRCATDDHRLRHDE